MTSRLGVKYLVGRLRSLRKFLFALSLSLCALLFLTLLASQAEQHLFRRRAELLLSHAQSLELRKTSWQEALVQFQRWGANREFGKQCDSHECSLQITLNEFVFDFLTRENLFVKLDDYFRWRLKLSYDIGPFVRIEQSFLHAYIRVGGRPARIIANIGMRDGIVWSKGISVWIETYGHPAEWSRNERFEFSLLADAHSVRRFRSYDGQSFNPQLALHPNYMIGRPGGCTICVMGWTKFTPYADSADANRLMQLDLSCLTRWRPCVTQGDIMPAAWAQYLAEGPRVDASWRQLACSSSVIEVLGRESDNIISGEVTGYREKVNSCGYPEGIASVRLFDRLKGAGDWNVGDTRDVSMPSQPGWAEANLRRGDRLILFGGWGRPGEISVESDLPCAPLPASETNLSLVRRGIDEDYSALGKTK